MYAGARQLILQRRILIGFLFGAAACTASLPANEPAQAFLDGLRERRFFDSALDYLAKAANDPAVPDSFKELIPYERGTTLIQAVAQERDAAAREGQLDEAQKALREFIKAKPNNLYAVSARSQLGNVIVERAKSRVDRSKKLAGAEQQKALKEARDF